MFAAAGGESTVYHTRPDVRRKGRHSSSRLHMLYMIGRGFDECAGRADVHSVKERMNGV